MAEAVNREVGPGRHPPAVEGEYGGDLTALELPEMGSGDRPNNPCTEGNDLKGGSFAGRP